MFNDYYNNYYRNYENNYGHDRPNRPNRPYYPTQETLELIKEAVEGEKEDAIFYEYLIEKAPNAEQKKIIKGIRNDEIKHRRLFREIYRNYTGMDIKQTPGKPFKEPPSYKAGIKKALFGELKAMEKYRNIRAGLYGKYYRDMVFEILTDEIKHAIEYNYILSELK